MSANLSQSAEPNLPPVIVQVGLVTRGPLDQLDVVSTSIEGQQVQLLLGWFPAIHARNQYGVLVELSTDMDMESVNAEAVMVVDGLVVPIDFDSPTWEESLASTLTRSGTAAPLELGPQEVDTRTPFEVACAVHGRRYGLDWVYAGSAR